MPTSRGITTFLKKNLVEGEFSKGTPYPKERGRKTGPESGGGRAKKGFA